MKKIFFRIFLSVAVLSTIFGGSFTAHAQQNEAVNIGDQAYETKLETCVLNFMDSRSGTLQGCLIRVFYHMVLRPSGWFAEKSAKLFDFFMAYSLDSRSYVGGNGDFVNQGWTLIRDIANVVFIFVLLYIAIRHILSMGGDTKKLLISLIIAALLINFSLFFSKVIIDASNILARAFYNNIEVEFDDTTSDVKTISQALAAKVAPQKLLSSEIFSGEVAVQGQATGTVSTGYAFFVMALAAAVNIIMGVVFLSAMLLFVGRVIGLWFMMIFSPLAFASIAVPGGEGMLGQFGWKGWKDSVLKLAFMAPIFLFFLFLLVMFLQIVESAPVDSSQPAAQTFMSVLIPFIVIIVVLQRAKKLAGDMAGEFGSSLTSVAGKAFSFIGGTALGMGAAGTAVIARATVGRVAAGLSDRSDFKEWASRSKFGRQLYKINTAAAKGSFDARNSAGMRKTTGLLAQGLAAAGANVKLDAGKGTTKGGYVQRFEAYQKEKEKFKDELKSNESDVVRTQYTDANGAIQHVEGSIRSAETAFLRAQNIAKRPERTIQVTDANGGTEDYTGDYDGIVKGRDKAEKAQNQAQTDHAAAQRALAVNPTDATLIANMAAADDKLRWARQRHDEFKTIVKDIESGWQDQEKAFKAIKRAQAEHDTNIVRNYAESVRGNAVTWVYDIARGENPSARASASAELARSAEKEEKKAQAEAKKDDKH